MHFLCPVCVKGVVSPSASALSRPMQRKLVTLVNCQLVEEEGRVRALRAARSLGERTITELILQHQNPQQLSANLWAAVRARGCQFLGPGESHALWGLRMPAFYWLAQSAEEELGISQSGIWGDCGWYPLLPIFPEIIGLFLVLSHLFPDTKENSFFKLFHCWNSGPS